MDINFWCCQLFGIKNPKVNIGLRNETKIDRVDVLVDGVLYKDYREDDIIINDNILHIHLIFPSNISHIKIVMISNDVDVVLLDEKYDYFVRSKKVITKPFRVVGGWVHRFFYPMLKAIKLMWIRHHFLIPPRRIKRYLDSFLQNYKHPQVSMFYNPNNPREYRKWLSENTSFFHAKSFEYNPLISFVIPVYNVKADYLEECIKSVLDQSYENFEICIADDNSSLEETKKLLKKYDNHPKIKIVYRKENGMISKCMNSAIELANGEYIGFLDNDDVLDSNALYFMVKEINRNHKLDLIYSDEDKLDENGKLCDPFFKPDWSPDTLLSLNYICHFTIIRKKLFDDVGRFRSEYDGSQDYDLFLRVTEKTSEIGHVSKLLYHWRKSATSTAANNDNKNYARLAGKKALEDALKRRCINGKVLLDEKSPYYIIKYGLKKEPKISIVIPTKDHKQILEQCIFSIFQKTLYHNFEVIVVDNNTTENDAVEFLKYIEKKYDKLRVIHDNSEFNYSKINNSAIEKLDTDYVVLLNNDTEVITGEWLNIMVGYASQSHIGCVGVKLLYPDETIQHAGVILGLGGVASHAYVGADRNDLGYFGRLCVPYNYSANTAACIIISKKKYDEVNGLDEKLKVAYNDVDFNIKLLCRGYFNVFLPQVELFHYESKSRGLDTVGEKKKRFENEEKYMYDKWKNTLYKDRFYNSNFSLKGWFMLDRFSDSINLNPQYLNKNGDNDDDKDE